MRDALSSEKFPPKSKGMERGDGLLEWRDQGCGGFTPITSQHGDLSPVHPDLDVGMSPPQVPLSPRGQDSTGGWMRMGSSSQPRKHPKRWQDLPSTNQLKRSFIGQFKDSQTKPLPCRNERCIPTLPHDSASKRRPGKARGGGGAMPGHGILR